MSHFGEVDSSRTFSPTAGTQTNVRTIALPKKVHSYEVMSLMSTEADLRKLPI